ncbi:hypothetical protein PORY_001758 [Pneumocystis oryctolagi]|uniref:Uncharacterized protein n=1 Tax=Pneumocystis oryctolagi TaxID=42067 RepID=A0ACB7CCE8_9ASCO|nr:hypothetical protein PORY_001758 [Pneumocystis oryctolagi]
MRKPPDTSLRQQRLRAWNPVLTPKTVLPIFFFLGFFFTPLGAGLLYFSTRVHEIVINYTYCEDFASDKEFSQIPMKFVQTSFSSIAVPVFQWKKYINNMSLYPKKEIICVIRFNVPTDLRPPVFIYYKLTNFYQNHRRYVKSVSRDQMLGLAKTASELRRSDDCNPLVVNEDGRPIYPCGLIANSFFNDTIGMPIRIDSKGSKTLYPMTNKGISWASDKSIYIKTSYRPSDVVPPPNWMLRYPNGYNQTNFPNINEWEEFHVWMKTAGLPTFEKLALRNDINVMKAGTYEIEIGMHFPVIKYNGSKSLLISTRSIIGGRNPFLGIAYISTGILSIVVGMLFMICHLIRPRKLGDYRYLSWNRAPSKKAHQIE